MLIYIQFRERYCVTVHRPKFWVREGLFLSRFAQIDLATATLVVALLASNEAALAVPERRLAIVASVASDIRASLRVHVNKVINGVTASWRNQCTVTVYPAAQGPVLFG